MGDSILFWRRTDCPGLERLALSVGDDGVTAAGTVIGLDDGGFRLTHRWRLTPDWRATALEVERHGPSGTCRLSLHRGPEGWSVDGVRRPDLDGCDEPDLSVTPFCNTLPIRRLPVDPGADLTLDTCYVDAATMTVARSRQRYIRLAGGRVRYVDLGLSAGFEAELEVDDRGLVVRYQHLFERLEPSGREPQAGGGGSTTV
ncbi:putative glycolipid-binding domain-containing protein [Caenispirillum bisanense]|uniref:putative glycolipid-binding domain-containing protein n=1 Tax=Caenispirillum bisanense TaxID=414052 RepID=UPI0031D0B415